MVTESDRNTFECLALNKRNLGRFAWEFERSVELFEYMGQIDADRRDQYEPVGTLRPPFGHYQMIAGRDAALNIYHFYCAITAVRIQLSRCKSLQGADHRSVKIARQIFEGQFPHTEHIRNAVAHAGELAETPGKMMDTMALGHQLVSSISGSIFSVGKEGSVFSVTINKATTGKLRAIKARVDDALPMVS